MRSSSQPPFRSSRRDCLRFLGSGVTLGAVSLAGCGLPAVESGSADLAISEDAAVAGDPRYRWLTQAARAPSAHNMQPWRVVLAPDAMMLYIDPQRLLPEADPSGRQTMVSMGAFLELLLLSAQADGYECDVALFPDGESIAAPVARIRTAPTAENTRPNELLAYVRQRHSNRSVYTSDQTPPPETLATLLAAAIGPGISAHGTLQPQQVAQIGQRAAEAWRAELGVPGVLLETLRVTRVGRREIEAYRDGIAVQGFWPELAATLGMFPRDRVPTADSIAMKNMQAMGEAQAHSAAGWIWLTSSGNQPAQQLAAGCAYVRLHLAATQHGIALHPMSQALEAYPAMVEHYLGLYRDLGIDPQRGTVQMLARIGYAAPGSTSLRRSPKVFLKEGV